jgi:hypothetical protein
MTQYAYFDSTVPAPSPVLGWYDTEAQPHINLVAVTPAQWAARTTGFYAISQGRLIPYVAPAGNPSAVALANAIAAGIAITSTATPSLNGTYALDSVSTAQIYQIGLYASQFGVFPSGNSTFVYPDGTGTPHVFAVTDFINFLHAVAALVTDLNTQAQIMLNGGTPTWPVQTATIA